MKELEGKELKNKMINITDIIFVSVKVSSEDLKGYDYDFPLSISEKLKSCNLSLPLSVHEGGIYQLAILSPNKKRFVLINEIEEREIISLSQHFTFLEKTNSNTIIDKDYFTFSELLYHNDYNQALWKAPKSSGDFNILDDFDKIKINGVSLAYLIEKNKIEIRNQYLTYCINIINLYDDNYRDIFGAIVGDKDCLDIIQHSKDPIKRLNAKTELKRLQEAYMHSERHIFDEKDM